MGRGASRASAALAPRAQAGYEGDRAAVSRMMMARETAEGRERAMAARPAFGEGSAAVGGLVEFVLFWRSGGAAKRAPALVRGPPCGMGIRTRPDAG